MVSVATTERMMAANAATSSSSPHISASSSTSYASTRTKFSQVYCRSFVRFPYNRSARSASMMSTTSSTTNLMTMTTTATRSVRSRVSRSSELRARVSMRSSRQIESISATGRLSEDNSSDFDERRRRAGSFHHKSMEEKKKDMRRLISFKDVDDQEDKTGNMEKKHTLKVHNRFKMPMTSLALGSSAAVQFISTLFVRAALAADTATIADPATLSATTAAAEKKSDWISPLSDSLEALLKVLDGALEAVHVPYSYGFAIILLTLFVKVVTFPLSKTSVESTVAMQRIQPRIAELKAKYPNDQEKLQLETARLYQSNGINPLAGCVPTLATIPIFIGLYRGLTQAADDGLLADGFFFIPSLSGPTSIAARQSGTGLQWLYPFVDGHPPIGWHDATSYLIMPALIIVSQYVSQAVLSAGNPAAQEQQNSPVFKFLPLMLGYFSLNVPSGLTLYWFTNNVLSTAQQAYLRGSVSAAADEKDSVAGKKSGPIQAEFTESTTSTPPPKPKIPLPPSAVMDEFPGMNDSNASVSSNGTNPETIDITTSDKPMSKAARKRSQKKTRRR